MPEILARGGLITDHLDELNTAGFIASDEGLNPATGRLAKCTRYRISDNYTRFYLKYILPYAKMIDDGAYRFVGLDALPGWDAILGLQFENLIVNNMSVLRKAEYKGRRNSNEITPFPWRCRFLSRLAKRFCGSFGTRQKIGEAIERTIGEVRGRISRGL